MLPTIIYQYLYSAQVVTPKPTMFVPLYQPGRHIVVLTSLNIFAPHECLDQWVTRCCRVKADGVLSRDSVDVLGV